MRRIVLLGASNLTVSFPRILHALENAFDGPLEVFSALGHGRSFGLWSRLLRRELPGIVGCGLWEALLSRPGPAIETLGLVTDVGNDLLYGASPPQIADWVETCLERMTAQNADVVMTSLPMGSVEKLSSWRYYATRSLFFPRSRITWPDMLGRVHELNERLETLGQEQGVQLVGVQGDWYGFDPIHIRHTKLREAWQRILSGWSSFPSEMPTGQPSPTTRLRLLRIQPQLRRVFGRQRITGQPVLRHGRLSVWLY